MFNLFSFSFLVFSILYLFCFLFFSYYHTNPLIENPISSTTTSFVLTEEIQVQVHG
jgi:hypothetical protein